MTDTAPERRAADDPAGLSRLRCAPFRAGTGAAVHGTATTITDVLVVEVPLPWGFEVADAPPLAGLRPLAAATGTRLMAMVPELRGAGRDDLEVVRYRHRTDIGAYERSAWRCEPDRMETVCRAVLEDRPPEAEEAPFTGRELLLCTHGRRDTCCGSLGTALQLEVAHRFADRTDVRVRRCSHTGGHRFAPTGLTFPDGYAWAFLTADAVGAVLDAPGAAALPHCRGWSALPGGPLQVADVSILGEVGPDWATVPRTARVVAFERDTLATTVEVRSAAGTWRVGVEAAGWVPQPTCGGITEPEYRVEPDWRVSGIAAL